MDLPGNSQPSPRAGRGPADPGKRMVGKVHLQRHHPLRPGRLRLGGRRGAERRRTRRAAATVPPAPRCLPRAARRGGGLFAHAKACGFGHRSRHRTPNSGSIKVRVLTRAKGGCECCGAHEHQRALEVDHIMPRNQGGSDDLSNLQALCFRCNAGKRNTDTTDFRGLQASYASREAGCVFCALEASGRALLENELALCIADPYPETPEHSLVIPRRHVADGLALHQPEWNAVVELLKLRREQLSAQHALISGWAGSLIENRGAELKRGSGADGVSCTLAFDSKAGGRLGGAAGWGTRRNPGCMAYG